MALLPFFSLSLSPSSPEGDLDLSSDTSEDARSLPLSAASSSPSASISDYVQQPYPISHSRPRGWFSLCSTAAFTNIRDLRRALALARLLDRFSTPVSGTRRPVWLVLPTLPSALLDDCSTLFMALLLSTVSRMPEDEAAVDC